MGEKMASFCHYFNQAQCRSCDWIELEYSKQLEKKEALLQKTLTAVFVPDLSAESLSNALADMSIDLKIAPQSVKTFLKILEPVGSPEQEFRDRAKMVVTGSLEEPVIGLAGEADLDEGRELLSCPIHHPKLNELIAAMPEFILKYNLAPYRIAERRGELKGLIAFYSRKSDQMYLRFILRSKDCVARIKKMLPTLLSRFPRLVCVSANIQPVPHAILEGPEEIVLTDRASIDHGDLKLTPRAFVQTNGVIADQLYKTAASWIAEARGGTASNSLSSSPSGSPSGSMTTFKMLELFCGQGAFSFYAAKESSHPTEVLGIEINSDAVQTANETAKRLGFNFMKFRCEDATNVEDLLEGIKSFRADLILANPPRRGLAQGLELLQKTKPQHILYSSCDVESLATDLKALSSEYHLERVQLFDMFPHTRHFETLVWLKRN
jgi:23S rRNA (uracil747-C5)-methyltransferase